MPDVPSGLTRTLRQWTTAQVRSVERLDYWVGAICEAFLDMDCSSRAAECFDGELTHLPLAQLALNRVRASTQDVYRTPAGISSSSSHPFYLITQTEHAWNVKQGGRVVHLRPGDAIMVDSARTYELHFPEGVNCLSVQMPRAWVNEWLRTVDTAEAKVAHREQGWGQTLSALCQQLGRQPELALHMAPDRLEEHFGALLGAALEPASLSMDDPARKALHQRAVNCMVGRLDRPGWRAADLAAELGVSLRSLHRAFCDAGETVAGRWRQLRMERARMLLSQQRLAGLPMSEIAWRCGYSDASHFARDFQRSFGQTPLRWARERRRT